MQAAAVADPPPRARNLRRQVLAVTCSAHAVHDGFTDVLYLLLPIWQAGFGLDYAAVGMLRALSSGTLAALQVPSSWLARRIGGAAVLAGGTAVIGLAYLLAGASTGLVTLGATLVLVGVGLSTQHPIASSLVAQAYDGAGSRMALGTYNFAGDLGKMAVPAATGWLVAMMSWRPAVSVLGLFGCAAAVLIALGLRALRTPAAAPSAADAAAPSGAVAAAQDTASAAATATMRRGFRVLMAIGVIDSATRMAFLTFLPFVLRAKGAELPTVAIALTLIFAGGAAGKFVCGFLGQRLGVLGTVYLTEGLTAAGILALMPLSLTAGMIVLPLIGIALNGTSSVLYGTVPELTWPQQTERAFALFYTGVIGSGALSPVLYGALGDLVGAGWATAATAAAALATFPLAFALAPHLASRRGGA